MTKFFTSLSFAFLICLFGSPSLVNAQEISASSPPALANLSALSGGPSYRNEWLTAVHDRKITAKQKIAEQIGEEGAKRFAAQKGWEQILVQGDKGRVQGFDQVYRSADGILHVVEAKGGTSPLGHGYGYSQGTPEWAVEAAKKTLKNHMATEAEKRAARMVLEAAAEGKLNVHVVRTPHVQGKPGLTIVESMTKSTPKSIALAKGGQSAATSSIAAQSIQTTEKAAQAASQTAKASTGTVEGMLHGASKVVPRVAVPVAVVVEVGTRGYSSMETEKQYAAGTISQRQRVENHAGNVGGAVGGTAGAYGGACAGAAAGAAVGSVVPIVGTAIGGIIGGIAGGAGGYFAGDWLGEETGRAATRIF